VGELLEPGSDALADLGPESSRMNGCRARSPRPGTAELPDRVGQDAARLRTDERWHEALQSAVEIPEADLARGDTLGPVLALPAIHVARGNLPGAQRMLSATGLLTARAQGK
jgi:hypothetical protein